MKKWLIIIITFGLLAINCTVFSADEEQDTTMQPNSVVTKCSIYIIFSHKTGAGYCPIYINGLLRGCLKPKSYIYCPEVPGETKIAYCYDTYSEIILDTVSGQNYYVTAQTKLPTFSERMAHGSLPFCEFKIIDKIEGEKLLSECSVVDWSNKNS